MRWRRIALIAVVLIAAAGISVGGWALFAYNELTKIDRSDPEVVTDEFLRAALVRKDQAGADLYACKDQAGLQEIKALRDELDRRERDFGVTIIVSWGAYTVDGNTLGTDVTLIATKDGVEQSSSRQAWRFTLVDESGWRVCVAEKVETTPS